MINKNAREKLIDILDNLLPEKSKIKTEKEELDKYVNDWIESKLTDELRELMDKYPDVLNLVSSLSIRKYDIMLNLCGPCEKKLTYFNFFNDYSIKFDLNKKYPAIISLRDSFILPEKKLDDFHLEFKKRLTSYVELLDVYYKKLEKIKNIINNKYLTLLILGKYYPELYTAYYDGIRDTK